MTLGFPQRLLRKLVERGLRALPTSQIEEVVTQAVCDRVGTLSPRDGLCFLFRMGTAFYPVLSRKAVEYDGGVHTKHRHTRYHDFFVGRVRPGERVLDIGCGIGAVAYDIAVRAGAQVVGIDLSPHNIATAQDRYRHPHLEFLVHDGTKPLPGKTYDVLVLSNILEHLPERPTFLRQVREAMSPSRVLIRVPLFERDWQVPLKKELGVEWRLDATHEIEYTLESFAQEIAEAGLKILHQEVRWGEIWAEVAADGA